MIVSMTKTTVLTLDRYRQETLTALRRIGVLHPAPVTKSEGEPLEKARREYQEAALVVNCLERRAKETSPTNKDNVNPPPPRENDGLDPAATVSAIRENITQQRETAEHRALLEREISATEPLGNFEPGKIRALERQGISIKLFRRRGKKPVTVPADKIMQVLYHGRNETIYAVLGPDNPAPANPADQTVPLPARSLDAMRAERDELDKRLAGIERSLDQKTDSLPRLREFLTQKEDQLRFAETSAGMGQKESIVYLQGYCPKDKIEQLQTAAREHGWGLLLEKPAPGDAVPTLIKHPAWVRPIRSVLNLMGILPGYREIDVSAAFLLFFSLFFAMIVGDAGYGFVFLGLTALAHRRWRRVAPPEPFRLMTVLSVCTIAWGLLTGNIFGTEWFPTLVPWFEAEGGGPHQQNLMLFCFLIGAVHLTVAHAWNALTIINTPQALAQAGWIALTWTMFLTARSLILGAVFPAWGYALLGVGLVLVIVFMTPRRLFKTEWISHAMLPLTVINNFVDVVSYVRLFAVGYASLAVAQAFNNMAIGDETGILRGLLAALILFGGHTLNIILCILSVLVHGIRLNTLEFSGHVGMQWTGFAYRPFAAATGEEE